MTATYQRSKAGRATEKMKRKAAEATTRRTPPEPPTEFFTPTSPEPFPLYALIEDWNRGIIPSNASLVKFFSTWKTSPILASSAGLSPAGLSLVEDLKSLGQVMMGVINEKNGDELLQRFAGHLRLAGRVWRTQKSGQVTVVEDIPHRRRVKLFGRRAAQVKSELGSSRQTMRKDARELLSLLQLLVTSTDFRTLIMDIQKIARRAFNLKPGAGAVESERPPVKQATTATTTTGVMVEEEEIHRGLRETREDIQELREEETPPTPSTMRSYRQEKPFVMEYYESGVKVSGAGAAAGVNYGSDVGGVQEEQQQKEARTEPQEQREQRPLHNDQDQLLMDAKELFAKLSRNSVFKESIMRIFHIFTRWQKTAATLPGTTLPSDIQYDANFTAAQHDLLQLAERFAGGASLQPILKSVAEVRQEASQDYELNDFFMDWRSFLQRCTTDADYLEHEEYLHRGRSLLNRRTDYADKKYRRLFQENMDNWNTFISGWQGDKLTSEVGGIVGKIVNEDIFARSGGRGLLNLAMIQPSLLGDLRNVILPAALRSLYELPLPHMEIEQGGMKIALDNIVLPASLFAPAILDLVTSSKVHVTPKERFFGRRAVHPTRRKEESKWTSGVNLALSGMVGEIRGVNFALDRKTFPKLRDRGTCKVRLGGRGLSIAVDVATDIAASQRRFHIDPVYVKVTLDRLALKFYNVQHDVYFAIAKPYLQSMMKTRIERAIRDRIVTTIYQVDNIASRFAKGVSVV